MPRARRVRLLTGLLLCGVATSAHSVAQAAQGTQGAQGCDPATHFAPVNAELHSYTGDAEDPAAPAGASLPHNCQQQYRLFLPEGERPPTGWPVLVCTALGGYVASGVNRCIDKTTLQGRALQRGIAVIVAGLTHSTEVMNCETGQQQLVGHGLFHPPGYVPPGLEVAPYDSRAYAMPEKDAVMLVQHVRHRGGRPGLLADVDPRRVAVLGQSAGANSFMWAALGPDRRAEEPFAGLGGQFDEPTRPDLAVLLGGFVWWPIFNPGVKANLPYFVLHFGERGDAERAAPTLAACDPRELQAASALWYQARFPEPSLPVLMVYSEASYCADYGSDGPTADFAYSFTGGGLEGVAKVREDSCDDGVPPNEEPGGMHPSWAGFTWKAQHPASCRLVIQSAETFACFAAGTEAEPPQPSMDATIVDWLVERFAELPSPWSVFEQAEVEGVRRTVGAAGSTAVAGLIAVPKLIGSGSRITLSGARPKAAGRLYAWGSAEPRLEHGGVMLPLVGPESARAFTTDERGEWSCVLDDTPHRSGEVVWYQAWIDDPGAGERLAGSNALRLTVP